MKKVASIGTKSDTHVISLVTFTLKGSRFQSKAILTSPQAETSLFRFDTHVHQYY